MKPASLESLNVRLRKLEDIEEIRNLRMSYHQFVNEETFDRFDEIFSEDALVDFGYIGRAKGIQEVRDLFLKIPRSVDVVKQFIHNHIVNVDGDDATGLAYLDARYARAGKSLMVAASFREKYRRTPKGWKICETIVNVFFSVPLDQGWGGGDLHHVKPFT